MLNIIISLATGLALFTMGCIVGFQIAPTHRSSTAGAIRIAASCGIALIAAVLLYVYLEG